MAEAPPVERLRAYLQELKPEARAQVLATLEQGIAHGDDMPGGDLVLQELRRTFRNTTLKAQRISDPARLFFALFEPFLVDDEETAPAGRIARAALEPIWQWMCRDLLPANAKAYAEEVERARGDDKIAMRHARAFQDLAALHIQEALSAAGQDERARRRLAAQVGASRALDNLAAMLGVLHARDTLVALSARLPPYIRNLDDEQLENIKTLLDSPIARHPDVFANALLAVMNRLTVPWQLVRLAVKGAESDLAERIMETRYAAVVTIVLTEATGLVSVLRRDLKEEKIAAVGVVLKEIHDAVRMLRTELDLSGDTAWSRDLAALHITVSELIEEEIALVPGRVRRLLRPRSAKEIVPGIGLDPNDVSETESLIELVQICRNYASELAINEVTLRVHSEIHNFLDINISLLVEALRSASPTDRAFRVSQVEAAVRFAGRVFGPGYASLVAKAAEVAQKGERKAGDDVSLVPDAESR